MIKITQREEILILIIIILTCLLYYKTSNEKCICVKSTNNDNFRTELPMRVLQNQELPTGAKPKGIIPKLGEFYRYPGNRVIDTTNENVPQIFINILKGLAPIDEKISTAYPAQEAVSKMEAIVGWTSSATFQNVSLINNLQKEAWLGAESKKCPLSKESLLAQLLNGTQLNEIMDIVIPTIRDLEVFLEKWKPFIESFHIIIIQDGDPQVNLKIPSWADFELYNRKDIENYLGSDSWIISQKDASIRNFGFLASRKKLVLSLDDDCYPAIDGNGKPVNAIIEHALNLLTPSTPYFFNTVYDPFYPCSDFVRGYPYSLRRGIQTVVSHGLWLNNYDYDAPTQLLKVEEKNQKYADITVTIPKRVLFPLCSMNVAFNRELLGPALMQGII
jgi:hypothetical protein